VLRYDARWWLDRAGEGRDLLKPLYEDLFPRALRHSLGEYYTPDWLARHVLDQVGYAGQAEARLLDPACGSGTFLVAAIRRLRATLGSGGPGALAIILKNVVGVDLHPLAAASARANYLMAIADLLADAEEPEIPVYTCDAILDGPGPAVVRDGFDYVVGNPPWIAWDNLPKDYRGATAPLWQRYGLFSLSGREARHGGGKKDLAMLMLYVAADRYLRSGGRLGMVIPQTLFQTKGAGDGFRRFRLGPDGDWLGVQRVDDLVAVRPFGNVANRAGTIVLEKGRQTQYPVHYVKWRQGAAGLEQEYCLAAPIAADQPGSPWLVRNVESRVGRAQRAPPIWPEMMVGLADQCCASVPVDPPYKAMRSDYAAHLGANSGGANAVYWLEVLGRSGDAVRVRNLAAKGKPPVETVETVIEPELLYPLIRWIDVDRYRARPSAYLLLAQDASTRAGLDPEMMARQLPLSLAYLARFESLLRRRAAYRRYQERNPFYSMYNVGPYTLAPVKVVWRRMDRRIRAAVVEPVEDPWLGRRPVVPQETCVLVACGSADEAHYLCAVLNSGPVHRLVAGHSVTGGKGFGTPGMLEFLPVQFYEPGDPRHVALAECSRQAHGLCLASGPRALSTVDEAALGGLSSRIDRLVADLWGLVSPHHWRS
jgi:SAM-dependent methyltransferase